MREYVKLHKLVYVVCEQFVYELVSHCKEPFDGKFTNQFCAGEATIADMKFGLRAEVLLSESR